MRAQRPGTYGQTLTYLQLPLCFYMCLDPRRQRLTHTLPTGRFLQPRSAARVPVPLLLMLHFQEMMSWGGPRVSLARIRSSLYVRAF